MAKPEYLIYGRQAVLEAILGDHQIEKILIARGAHLDDLRKRGKEHEIPVKTVPPEKLNRITSGNHQGVVAFLSLIQYYKISDILPRIYETGEVPLFVLLDGVTDVRNFGAIARTAYAAGVHAVIIPIKGSAAVNADAMKASAGALNHLAVCREKSLVNTLKELKLNGLSIIGSASDGLPVAQIDLSVPAVIVMGAEDTGMSPDIARLVNTTAALPMARSFDSYNVSVAAGMLLYEAMIQRKIDSR